MDEQKALEEIQFIRKVIEETKKSVVYNGKDYIFWGVLVIIGMVGMYTLIQLEIYFNYFYIWMALIPIGWIYSYYNSRKIKRKSPKTYASRLISSVWFAAGIGMSLIGFLGTLSRNVPYYSISPIMCIIMGSAYYVSGKVLETNWFKNLAYGWWGGGLILFYVKNEIHFLIMALLMLLFQTIPGIIVYKKYKKEERLNVD